MCSFSDASWDAVFTGPTVWPPNSYLLQQDVSPSTVYVLDEGVIKMVYVTPGGDECAIDVRRAPTLIGWPFIAVRQPALFDAITVTTCALRWCSRPAFLAALSQDPGRMTQLHEWHCAETLGLWERAVAMSLKSSKQRLEHLIATYGGANHGRGLPAALPFKRSLVASLIHVTPEHLSRLLKCWSSSPAGAARSAAAMAARR